MLSIVVYGRNDSYGYNLHKRAALGLNTMAELLDDPSDEILFVDYNTPDDFPTFPEAIADTLTARTHERLRILRVRPATHARFSHRTHLKALEPVARNVAIRRASPANRWVLSTNTDMIFVPQHEGASLSRVVAALPDGYYHLPRFELPETLWEGFDRRDPAGVIEKVARYSRSMCLNEVVYGHPFIKYDGPGDFQLILRDDLFAMGAFDEDMLLGWHVDSNIARRLQLLRGEVGDCSAALAGYHCDHTRQVTPLHQHRSGGNDANRFVFDLTSPYLPEQDNLWGCPDDPVEELRLDRTVHGAYVDAIHAAIGGGGPVAPVAYVTDTFDKTTYDARHVLPFIADAVSSAPRTLTAAWIGGRADTFGAFCTVWERLGFEGDILIDEWSVPLFKDVATTRVKASDVRAIDTGAQLLFFDFGAPSSSSTRIDVVGSDPEAMDVSWDRFMRSRFAALTAAEQRHLEAGKTPRRMVCVGAIHNQYESIVLQYIGAATAPFSTRLRQGFVYPPAAELPTPVVAVEDAVTQTVVDRAPGLTTELLSLLEPGDGGRRCDRGMLAPFGQRGYVVRGPFQRLLPGDYRVQFTIEARNVLAALGAIRPVILDVTVADRRVAEGQAYFSMRGTVGLTFTIPDETMAEDTVELRLFRGRFVDFIITGVTLTKLTIADTVDDTIGGDASRPTMPLDSNSPTASV